jgi:hypothetical protein
MTAWCKGETNNFFEELRKKYPDLVELWYAQELGPGPA